MRKGQKHTEESRRKITQGNLTRGSEWIEKMKASKRGRKLTEEHKKKISASMAGVKKSEEHRKHIGEVKKGNTNRVGKKNSASHVQAIINYNKGKIVSDETKAKIRATRIGTKATQDTKDKMSSQRGLDKHWNWKGGKSMESYTQEWTKEFKEEIRKRDNHTCQICGIAQSGKISFDVHHVDENKKNCSPDNLVTLCKSCHVKLHNIKKAA